jgi:phenylalanyl-tRNA synthetase alpha chain
MKYFSIDRVFRNENVDDTHLAEFHQIEGSVADYGLTLGDLMGIIQEFFKKLGITKLRFKPAYNPYTEPSMEIFSYHEGKTTHTQSPAWRYSVIMKVRLHIQRVQHGDIQLS